MVFSFLLKCRQSKDFRVREEDGTSNAGTRLLMGYLVVGHGFTELVKDHVAGSPEFPLETGSKHEEQTASQENTIRQQAKQ